MKDTIETLITDEQLNKAWGNANFGQTVTKREVIANCLLKYACGYSTGHTVYCICRELKLITEQERLTTLGKQYLWLQYSTGNSF